MKYNKKLQNRLNLSFNDYKDYSQLYKPIELELKLVHYKSNDNKFINISDDNMKCYHIYFDNQNKEVKRTELKWKDKVKVIKIIIDHQIKSFNDLFDYCNCIRGIYFKKFFRIDITNMSGIFQNCFLLRELDLSNFNTNLVTNMIYMFYGCISLKK